MNGSTKYINELENELEKHRGKKKGYLEYLLAKSYQTKDNQKDYLKYLTRAMEDYQTNVQEFEEHSKLCSRADLVDWLKTMLPDPWDYQGVTGSTYQQEIKLEYVSRPLWAIFVIASGDYDEMLVLPYIERIKYELNLKTKTVFLKPTTKTRQIAVEMAVYGYGLLCCQDKLLNYFSNEEIEYLETWLNSINEIEFPQNNWLLFLLIY